MKKIALFSLLLLSILSCNNKVEVKEYQGNNRQAIIDNLLTRRAIRKYTEQQVSKAQIDTIMKCAIYAPSALNKQPWEIRVVQNKKWLEEVNKRFLKYAAGKTLQGSAAHYKDPGFSIIHHAPTLIVIARDTTNQISYLDCGICLENVMLASHAIGLGTCPLGTLVSVLNLPENKDLLDALNIPEGYNVAINVALGYPAESPKAPQRYSEKVKIIE